MFHFNDISFWLHKEAQQTETLAHCKGSSLYSRDFNAWVSEYTAYQSFPKCRNQGRTRQERGSGKGKERVRNEERKQRQERKCKTTGLSYPQAQPRVKKKGIYFLSVEGSWIWPWNISNLIFCTLLSSLPYPTFLGQMLSKPVDLAPKWQLTSLWALGNSILPFLFLHEIYTFSFKSSQHATLFPSNYLDIFLILMTNFVKLNEGKWSATWGLVWGIQVDKGLLGEVLIHSQSKKT